MEPTITSNMTEGFVQNDKPKTSFIKNTPEVTKYSLSDYTNDKREMDYHMELITKEDVPAVIKFLKRFFFRDEPLNYDIGLIPEGEDSTCIELEEYSTVSIPDNISIKAISTSGAVIGVCLNGIMDPPKEGEPEYITNCKNSKFLKIVKMLYYVDKHANVAGKFPGKKVMELRIASVDTSWRGRGVGRALFNKTIELGRQQHFDILRVDCSSAFSSKLCESCGMKAIYVLKYADYLDEEGNPVFSPAYPHTEMRTYIRQLN